MDSEGYLVKLCSSKKLDRDVGLEELRSILLKSQQEGSDAAILAKIQGDLCTVLKKSDSTWEAALGALLGVTLLLGNSEMRPGCTEDFLQTVSDASFQLLEHDESRVRLAAGETFAAVCAESLGGPQLFAARRDLVLQQITEQLHRQPQSSGHSGNSSPVPGLGDGLQQEHRVQAADVQTILHETAGWKHLETWLKCLQQVAVNLGANFMQQVDTALLQLLIRCVHHENRFVRETGQYVFAAIFDSAVIALKPITQRAQPSPGAEINDSVEAVVESSVDQVETLHLLHTLVKPLGDGLADNWSQVRLASSVAARTFLQLCDPPTQRTTEASDRSDLAETGGEKVCDPYAVLVPRLCLNRYYVAEGVRVYSQETWRRLVASCTCVGMGSGHHLVEAYLPEVVKFYVEETEADNHAVREAACACIAELGTKVNAEKLRCHVPSLLDALTVCFEDDSWPVRDAACVASGQFVACFPEESRPLVPSLLPHFFENLQDNIASVRQDGAQALCRIVQSHSQESSDSVHQHIRSALQGVRTQLEVSVSTLEKRPATFGVVKRLSDEHVYTHSDKEMFSCGSLAPKMHSGSRRRRMSAGSDSGSGSGGEDETGSAGEGSGRGAGGCMDHHFRRDAQPWEIADGAVRLLAELSKVAAERQFVLETLPLVVEACSYKHYQQHVYFLETFCKVLATIAAGLGKRPFKSKLEQFLDLLFYALSSDTALTSAAAEQCLMQLRTYLGAGILRGRVENYNPSYLTAYDRIP